MPRPTAAPVHRFVALLRGINVGRGNRLAMADWTALMRGLGLGEVRTLLNSGNAVFSSPVADAAVHAAALRSALQQQLGLDVPVLVKPAAAWAAVVAANVLALPDVNASQLLVVLAPDAATLAGLQALAPLVQPPDRWWLGDDAAYLLCGDGILASAAAQALLGKAGRACTTRNWATVLKLQALLQA